MELESDKATKSTNLKKIKGIGGMLNGISQLEKARMWDKITFFFCKFDFK